MKKKEEGLNLFGGIIVEHENEFYLNENEEYVDFSVDKTQWVKIGVSF